MSLTVMLSIMAQKLPGLFIISLCLDLPAADLDFLPTSFNLLLAKLLAFFYHRNNWLKDVLKDLGSTLSVAEHKALKILEILFMHMLYFLFFKLK